MTNEQTATCDKAFREWWEKPQNCLHRDPPRMASRLAFTAGFRAGTANQTGLEQALRRILLVLDTEYTPEDALRLIRGCVAGALKVEPAKIASRGKEPMP